MTTIEAIETRRAVKHYDLSHRLTDAERAQPVSLAELAPSSFNMQNYRFVLAIGETGQAGLDSRRAPAQQRSGHREPL